MDTEDLTARITELETRLQLMEDVEARLQRMEDDRAIRELLARYGVIADVGQSEAYVALYTEDGAIDVSATHRTVGHAALMEFINGSKWMVGRCLHVQGINLVTHIDGDSAVAESYSIVLMREDNGYPAFTCNANRWTLQKVDGVWYIRERLIRSPGADGFETVCSIDVDT